jgi:hypothetical protein
MMMLILSGSMGAGKTAVMGEVSDLLLARGIQHAAIDLDMVQTPLLPDDQSNQVALKNAAALFQNCHDASIDRFIVACAIENRKQLDDLTSAAGATNVIVCRLTATHQTMADRLRVREPGLRQQEFIERARELDAALGRARLENFAVANDAPSITEVATEILTKANWF